MVWTFKSLIPLVALLAGRGIQVHAAGFGSDPVAVNPSAPQFLDENSPLRGTPLHRVDQQYAVINDKGQYVVMNGTKVVREEMRLQDAETGLQNTDLYYLAQALNTQFNYNTDTINAYWRSGRTSKISWPGSYWPSYLDGINYRWSGDASPAEKYARATGMDANSFMDQVSYHSGIDGYAGWYSSCYSTNDCEYGNECGIRDGHSSGWCIPSWAGICHGWAPAAMLEEEPRCSVWYNGVNFEPVDLKALMSQIYDEAGIGVRYVGALVSGSDYDTSTDQYGRYINLARRDIGPAAFHILCTSMIGRDQRVFLIDADSGAQVWNQPALRYEISEPWVMDPSVAAQWFFGINSYDSINANARTVHYVQNAFTYVTEGYENGALVPDIESYTVTVYYQYLLEVDGNNNIIGGEWVGDSRYEHPDIVWVPLNTPQDGLVTPLGISYSTVKWLTSMSANC